MTKEEIENQIHDFALRINSMGFLDGYSKGLDDRKKEIEKARKEGYDEGVTDTIFNTDTYIQGLNDAWECARKIVNSYNCNWSDSIPKYADIFGEYLTVHTFDISASEAIAKIKEYEDKHTDNEIKLWDEVIIKKSDYGYTGHKGVVVQLVDSSTVSVMFDYHNSHWYHIDNLEKTGKSYPELGNILDQLKGDNDQ